MPDIKTQIRQITKGIPRALGPDRYPIRRELDRIRGRAKKGACEEKTAQALEKLYRRIAAITVAARIAEELGETPGDSVGCKIRFHDKTGPDAYIKIMTDGILLAKKERA